VQRGRCTRGSTCKFAHTGDGGGAEPPEPVCYRVGDGGGYGGGDYGQPAGDTHSLPPPPPPRADDGGGYGGGGYGGDGYGGDGGMAPALNEGGHPAVSLPPPPPPPAGGLVAPTDGADGDGDGGAAFQLDADDDDEDDEGHHRRRG
jgi:hypothetical protein